MTNSTPNHKLVGLSFTQKQAIIYYQELIESEISVIGPVNGHYAYCIPRYGVDMGQWLQTGALVLHQAGVLRLDERFCEQDALVKEELLKMKLIG